MMHLKAILIDSVARRSGVYGICVAVFLSIIDRSSAITPSIPVVRSNVVSFSFDSVPDQLFTVQSSESLSAGWVDAAYYRGTGARINFSAPATNISRFF